MIQRLFQILWFILVLATPAFAQGGADPKPLIDQLGSANFKQAEDILGQIAATGDTRVVPALEAFAEGDLYLRKADNAVFIAKSASGGFDLIDPLTGESAGTAAKADITKIKVNNTLRRAIRSALGGLTLLSPDRDVRLAAADSVLKSPSADNLALVEAALAKETDPVVKVRMEEARAVSVLTSDRPVEDKRQAVATIKNFGGREAISILSGAAANADPALAEDINSAIASIQSEQELWDVAQNVWYGLSLGSVLLLAAIGLAITFGVMGIINMAHGEMVMLGAYTPSWCRR